MRKPFGNDENPRRLIHLYMYEMGRKLYERKVDLAALDKLEILSFDRQ